MATTERPHLVVIDPAARVPELECFNYINVSSPVLVTYHLPAMHGFQSIEREGPSYIRGVIIFGSGASVYDNLPWQARLNEIVKDWADKGVPTLGLCYGHQMLAHIYGGKVNFIDPKKEFKHSGLRQTSVVAKGPFEAGLGPLVVSHREAVTQLPDSMEVLATSPEVEIDGLIHRKLPIYGFQSHPEATPGFLINQEMNLEPKPESFQFGYKLMSHFIDFATKN